VISDGPVIQAFTAAAIQGWDTMEAP
jgi:hypothetical protein